MMIQQTSVTASISFLLLLSSSSVLGQQQQQHQQEALDKARALWEGVLNSLDDGEPVDYNYAYMKPTETFPEYEVLVRDRTEVSAYTIYDPPEERSLYTVEQVFGQIQEGLENSNQVQAKYDRVLGHPIFWSIKEGEGANGKILYGGRMDRFTLFPLIKKDYFAHSHTWELRGSDSYDYTIELIGYLPNEIASAKRIYVRNGSIERVIDIASGNAAMDYGYPTVEDIFSTIDKGLKTYFNVMETSYDDTFGYPTIYTILPDIFEADGESGAFISDVDFVENTNNIAEDDAQEK